MVTVTLGDWVEGKKKEVKSRRGPLSWAGTRDNGEQPETWLRRRDSEKTLIGTTFTGMM